MQKKISAPPLQISESNRRIIHKGGHSKRVYQVWSGSNRFFLGGRLIFGPDAKSLAISICMIVIPVILFTVFVSQKLVNEFEHAIGNLIFSIAITLAVYRNYRFFFMFISSTAVLCLYVFAFCWVHIKKIMDAHGCNLWRALMNSPVSGVLILYTFIVAWFVGGLTAFHLYLICINQTTYENFRYNYDGKTNPYNLGCFGNVWEIFFSRIPKSKNHFRAKVKEYLPPFSSSLSRGRAMSPDTAKTSFDLEMGAKRHAVSAEEFEDMQSQIDSVSGLERCSTQRPRSSWGSRKGSWEISHDMDAFAAEFGMEHGCIDREKILADL